jgi:hypothetical protein
VVRSRTAVARANKTSPNKFHPISDSVFGAGMLNRTLAHVRKHHHRDDRLRAKAAAGIDAMRHGQALHHQHDRNGPLWWLSKDGRRISNEIAQLVIKNPAIVGVGHTLPLGADIPAQTFRFAE